MTEILLTGPLSLNSINQQFRTAVIGQIALIFASKTINICAYFFIKNPNPFHKEPVTRHCFVSWGTVLECISKAQ